MALMNSGLFYLFFILHGDCFHLSNALTEAFPVPPALASDVNLAVLGRRLDEDVRANAVRKTIRTKDGDTIAYDEFEIGRSKLIIDEIDTLLAEHYGFTDEELDFIINYDIKYRVGAEEDSDKE